MGVLIAFITVWLALAVVATVLLASIPAGPGPSNAAYIRGALWSGVIAAILALLGNGIINLFT